PHCAVGQSRRPVVPRLAGTWFAGLKLQSAASPAAPPRPATSAALLSPPAIWTAQQRDSPPTPGATVPASACSLRVGLPTPPAVWRAAELPSAAATPARPPGTSPVGPPTRGDA